MRTGEDSTERNSRKLGRIDIRGLDKLQACVRGAGQQQQQHRSEGPSAQRPAASDPAKAGQAPRVWAPPARVGPGMPGMPGTPGLPGRPGVRAAGVRVACGPASASQGPKPRVRSQGAREPSQVLAKVDPVTLLPSAQASSGRALMLFLASLGPVPEILPSAGRWTGENSVTP